MSVGDDSGNAAMFDFLSKLELDLLKCTAQRREGPLKVVMYVAWYTVYTVHRVHHDQEGERARVLQPGSLRSIRVRPNGYCLDGLRVRPAYLWTHRVLGEVDDGTLYDALGLTTVDQAFLGSYGVWKKKKGDGSVTIYFESVDNYDVSVVIKSGGDKLKEVKVPANSNVTWTSTVEELQDKTLYLDRWRPGHFGLPGTGGGSLLMWIPRSSEGGQLILHARLNVS